MRGMHGRRLALLGLALIMLGCRSVAATGSIEGAAQQGPRTAGDSGCAAVVVADDFNEQTFTNNNDGAWASWLDAWHETDPNPMLPGPAVGAVRIAAGCLLLGAVDGGEDSDAGLANMHTQLATPRRLAASRSVNMTAAHSAFLRLVYFFRGLQWRCGQEKWR